MTRPQDTDPRREMHRLVQEEIARLIARGELMVPDDANDARLAQEYDVVPSTGRKAA